MYWALSSNARTNRSICGTGVKISCPAVWLQSPTGIERRLVKCIGLHSGASAHPCSEPIPSEWLGIMSGDAGKDRTRLLHAAIGSLLVSINDLMENRMFKWFKAKVN